MAILTGTGDLISYQPERNGIQLHAYVFGVRRVNVFLTGGAGFVGSHLAERLLEQEHHVMLVDNFDPFYARELKEANLLSIRHHPCLQVVEADICDKESLRRLAGQHDAIVHLAAKVGVRASVADPISCLRVNVLGTQVLLELAREWGVARFIFASSSSVYGNNPRAPWSESESVGFPVSPYASSKVSCELLGHVYSHLYGIRFTALRLFSVYGPRQRPDLVIRRFAELMLAGRSISIHGDGMAARDYTHIDDVISAIMAAIYRRGSSFEIFNIGGNRPVTLLEVVYNLEQTIGRTAIVDYLPSCPGDVIQTHADCSKAAGLLGYMPRVPFEHGIARFVAWLGAGEGFCMSARR
jgi:UDP-glucuronate 4-epimerase